MKTYDNRKSVIHHTLIFLETKFISLSLFICSFFYLAKSIAGNYYTLPKVIFVLFCLLFIILAFPVKNHSCIEYIRSLALFSSSKKSLKLMILLFGTLLIAAAISNSPFGANPIWQHDHGNFISRYANLNQTFPFLSGYDPFWQAGRQNRDGLVSGVLGIWILFYPFLQTQNIDQLYKYIGPILLLLFPIFSYITAKLFKFSQREAFCASLFSFVATGSLFSPINCLAFGMYPYFLTTILFPVFSGLVYRAWIGEGGRYLVWAGIVAFFASAHLTFLFMVLGLAAFFLYKVFVKLQLHFKNSTIIAVLLILFLFLMLVLFLVAPGLFKIGIGLFSKSSDFFKKIMSLFHSDIKDVISQVLPWMIYRISIFGVVLLLGGFQTIKWIRGKDIRGLFILFSGSWPLFLSIFGDFFFRGSQPLRYAAAAEMILLVPFAKAWVSLDGQFFKNSSLSRTKKSILSLCIIFIFFYAYLNISNSFSIIKPSPNQVVSMQNWISEEGSSDQRIFVNHDGTKGMGGTLGRLQQLTGAHFIGEQVADSSYFDRLMKHRKTIFSYEYFQTFNIHYLFLTASAFQDYVEHNLKLKPITQFGRIKVYKTGINTDFFLKGEGTVKVSINEINLNLNSTNAEEIIIRFKYVKGFTITKGVTAFAVPTEYKTEFIGIRPNGKKNITLQW